MPTCTFFSDRFGPEFTELVNSPDVSRFRVVEMITSCTDDTMKMPVIRSFSSPSHACAVIYVQGHAHVVYVLRTTQSLHSLETFND